MLSHDRKDAWDAAWHCTKLFSLSFSYCVATNQPFFFFFFFLEIVLFLVCSSWGEFEDSPGTRICGDRLAAGDKGCCGRKISRGSDIFDANN